MTKDDEYIFELHKILRKTAVRLTAMCNRDHVHCAVGGHVHNSVESIKKKIVQEKKIAFMRYRGIIG
jgi:hypothetical protein